MEKQSNEFTKYLKILYRRRFLFIAVSLVVMTVAIAICYRLPKQYQAASTIFIEKSIIDELVKGIAVTHAPASSIQMLRYDMLSREILSKVLREMEVDTPLANDAGFQGLVNSLQKNTEITTKGKEGLLIISFKGKNPKFAQDYVNTLVRTYVEQNIVGKREETFGASRFLDEQLALYKSKLDQAENAIALESLKEKQKQLKNQLRSVAPNVAAIGEGGKEDRINALERKIGQLLLTYTENYPEVTRLKAELETLKGQGGNAWNSSVGEGAMSTSNPMHRELRRDLSQLEAEISSLSARRAQLVGPAEAKTLELQVAPENKKTLATIEQERDSYRLVYEQLLQRRGQAEVTKQMDIGDKAATFRVLEPAGLPSRPVTPNMVQMILMAIAAGLGAGVGLILLRENLNPSVFQVQQLRDLGLEVCATIPSMVDPALEAQDRRWNRRVYWTSGLYFSGILCLLAFELMKSMA
jgi:uncharacterized protein involved in exopolysaccharide biosynthesis